MEYRLIRLSKYSMGKLGGNRVRIPPTSGRAEMILTTTLVTDVRRIGPDRDTTAAGRWRRSYIGYPPCECGRVAPLPSHRVDYILRALIA